MRGRSRRLAGGSALVAAAAVAVAVGVYVLTGGGSPSAEGPALGPVGGGTAALNEPAPDFALLDARDGTTVRRLSDYRGNVVVLNWFASWCAPCAKEMPDFEAAWRQASDRLVVLGVNLQESASRAREMLATLGVTYPAVVDRDGSVARAYGLSGMPTTFFIDEEGVVRSAGRGMVTAETLRQELAKLGVELEPWEEKEAPPR